VPQYAIEIAGPKNERVRFAPTGETLRGRWDQAVTAHRDKGDAMKAIAATASVIPGRVIVVETDKLRAKIIDPLAQPAGKPLLEKLNAVFKAHSEVFGGEVKPHPDQDHTLTADTLKDWLYWMRRLVDSKLAVIADGYKALPTLDEIRQMPGRRVADPNYTGQCDAKTPDSEKGLYKWTDEVPADGKKATATAS
jgi:hypothetical protein